MCPTCSTPRCWPKWRHSAGGDLYRPHPHHADGRRMARVLMVQDSAPGGLNPASQGRQCHDPEGGSWPSRLEVPLGRIDFILNGHHEPGAGGRRAAGLWPAHRARILTDQVERKAAFRRPDDPGDAFVVCRLRCADGWRHATRHVQLWFRNQGIAATMPVVAAARFLRPMTSSWPVPR